MYVHREVVTRSREGRPMEMITLTSRLRMLEEREDYVQGCFPDGEARPFKFKKPTVFISSRVHPGETPASFVYDGMINFLSQDTEQASALLDNFVFKFVPVLNPDGVARGYYRLDTLGQNLNRFYSSPDPVLQPTIFAVKQVIE